MWFNRDMKWSPPHYGLDKLKFAVGSPMFERAVDLYEEGRVKDFQADTFGYSAQVHGGNIYHVFVSAKAYDVGHCDCHMGQKEELCKHLVAIALHAVIGGRKLTDEEKQVISVPVSSGKLGSLDARELKETKARITDALRYIKAYTGPSRTWFTYQNSLDEGYARLSKIVSELPVGLQTAKLLVEVLLRLDRKLQQGGVDDSNGTIGGLIEGIVAVLKGYHAADSSCAEAFRTLKGVETCFAWEEPLLALT